MNVKALIVTVVETILKVVVLAVAIIYIFKGISVAYDFGYRVFADEPVSANNPRVISVAISESQDINDIAEMLEEKGLIEDSKLFVVQELLSAYHDEIKPGIYDLSTGMTATEMLRIMGSGDTVSTITDEDVPSSDNAISEDGEAAEDVMYEDGLLEDGADTTVEGAE